MMWPRDRRIAPSYEGIATSIFCVLLRRIDRWGRTVDVETAAKHRKEMEDEAMDRSIELADRFVAKLKAHWPEQEIP